MPSGFDPQAVEHPQAVPPPEVPLDAEGMPEQTDVQADEEAREQMEQTEDTFLDEDPGMTSAASSAATDGQDPAQAATVASPPDEIRAEVEKILEDGLGEYVKEWPAEAQQRFRTKGLEVAQKIADAVRTLQVAAKDVLILIRDWLLTIPGVNKFFLEQEAKIKTDRILTLEQEYRAEFAHQAAAP